MRSFTGPALLVVFASPLLGGCFLIKKPDKANIELRKQNQDQQGRITELERSAQGDAARIQALQDRVGTLPTLPQDRLKRLFTTHDIQLGRLTGGADLDPDKPGQEGLRVYLTPLDEMGDQLKAAGAIRVEAYEPSRDEGAKIGSWTFDAGATRGLWSSVLNRYNYVLSLPWQTPPTGPSLHLQVTFVDELTQGEFTKTVDVAVQPPPAAAPVPASGGGAKQP
jgi:hypothetical protein